MIYVGTCSVGVFVSSMSPTVISMCEQYININRTSQPKFLLLCTHYAHMVVVVIVTMMLMMHVEDVFWWLGGGIGGSLL